MLFSYTVSYGDNGGDQVSVENSAGVSLITSVAPERVLV